MNPPFTGKQRHQASRGHTTATAKHFSHHHLSSVAWIYWGRIKISDLSTWIDGSDLCNPWPIDKLNVEQCRTGLRLGVSGMPSPTVWIQGWTTSTSPPAPRPSTLSGPRGCNIDFGGNRSRYTFGASLPLQPLASCLDPLPLAVCPCILWMPLLLGNTHARAARRAVATTRRGRGTQSTICTRAAFWYRDNWEGSEETEAEAYRLQWENSEIWDNSEVWDNSVTCLSK